MALQLKHNVRLQNLQPQIIVAIMVANDLYSEFGHMLTVTSCNDSTHSRTSLHNLGLAIDLRIRNLDSHDATQITEILKSRLTVEFDVILESDHIHIEYQPKTGQ